MRYLIFLFSLFVNFSLWAQFNSFDGFSDNSNNWTLQKTADVHTELTQGFLSVKTSGEKTWSSFLHASIAPNKSFRAECGVSYTSANTKNSAGIMVGYVNDSTYQYFGITTNHEFIVIVMKDDTAKHVIAPVQHDAIRKDGVNYLRINYNYELNRTFYFINNIPVYEHALVQPGNNEFGLFCEGPGHALFDYIWLVQPGKDEFSPASLQLNNTCTGSFFNFEPWSMNMCLPSGMRVETDGQECLFWTPEHQHAGEGIMMSYAKVVLQDSFHLVARADYNFMILHSGAISSTLTDPGTRGKTTAGYETYTVASRITQQDQSILLIKRCYVYSAKNQAFFVLEIVQSDTEFINVLNRDLHDLLERITLVQ